MPSGTVTKKILSWLFKNGLVVLGLEIVGSNERNSLATFIREKMQKINEYLKQNVPKSLLPFLCQVLVPVGVCRMTVVSPFSFQPFPTFNFQLGIRPRSPAFRCRVTRHRHYAPVKVVAVRGDTQFGSGPFQRFRF